MNGLVDRLLQAQASISDLQVDEILGSLERVVLRWLDHGDPVRREAEERLGQVTGLAGAMLGQGLDQMVERVRGVGALLDQDLGSRYVLDRFVERAPGLRSRAWGPGLLVCVFSGNVPGIPAFDMALGLALKSAVLARPAAAEPHFAELWARSVAEVDERLGRCLAVQRWGYEESWAYQRAGAVLAYGSDESLAAIRAQVPAGLRFVGHGHKIGFAVVAREAAMPETARRLARDVAMYDQQGCVSPHMAFVERGGELAPGEFARACGEALEALEREMPRGRLSAAEAMALRSARDEAEFTADVVYASRDGLAWAVAHCERPEFLPSPLGRMLRTFAVDDVRQVVDVVRPFGRYLQTVGYAGDRVLEMAAELGRLGVSRVCAVGMVQQVGPLVRHDGVSVAGSLVRWTDIDG